jgi:orotate phosphoribosyltransferase
MTDRLLDMLREHSFRRGTFTLSSGKSSDFFIDCKPTVLRAEGHVLVGAALMDAAVVLAPDLDAVAGVELGGCSLASAVSYASVGRGRPLDAVYVRKSQKGHGTQKLLEGAAHLGAGARLVVLEDTVTTGGSTLRAVGQIRDAGFEVAGVVAVVDRLEGGREALTEAGLPYVSLYTRTDFMGDGAPAL